MSWSADISPLSIESPEPLGLPLVGLEQARALGSEARESGASLLWLPLTLLSLGQCLTPTPSGDGMRVELSAFQQALRVHKVKRLPAQIRYLTRSGFQCSDWNGKRFSPQTGSLTVLYPDDPAVLPVLAAAGRKLTAAEAAGGRPADGYRLPQCVHWFGPIFRDDTGEVPAYSPDFFASLLAPEQREAFCALHRFFQDQGLCWHPDEGYQKYRYYTEKGKDTLTFFEYTDYRYGVGNDGRLLLRLKLNKPAAYLPYLEQCPPHIQAVFERPLGCAHCMDRCNRRLTYALRGRTIEGCGCFCFQFFDPRPEDVQYLAQLYLLEQQARQAEKTKKPTRAASAPAG